MRSSAGSRRRPAPRTARSPPAEELRTLVTDDLALLLTERFHASARRPEERSALPARTTSFVGRDDELGELLRLVERSDVRLVTLTGPGGIGKTRLAAGGGAPARSAVSRRRGVRGPRPSYRPRTRAGRDRRRGRAALARPGPETASRTPPPRAAAPPRARQLRAPARRCSARHAAARGLQRSGGARDQP